MEIVLHSKGEDYTVLIDDEDFHKISKYTWFIKHYNHTKYCATKININGKLKNILLHRFLMGLEKEDKRIINHKDCNGLNNQKSNLEICDKNYNNQSINCKKKFGCIYIMKNRVKKYKAEVNINKKRYRKYFYTWAEGQSYLDGLQEIAKAETLPLS
jgi:hypothetical protein